MSVTIHFDPVEAGIAQQLEEEERETLDLTMDHVLWVLELQARLPRHCYEAKELAVKAHSLLSGDDGDEEKFDQLEKLLMRLILGAFEKDPAAAKYLGAIVTTAAYMLKPSAFDHRQETASYAHTLFFLQMVALQELSVEDLGSH